MKEGFSETNRMDFQAYADYKGTFGNGHRLGAVAGYEYMLDKLNSFDVRVQGAVSDKLPVLDAGTSNIANYPKSTRTRECLISYFGRVNYDYGGRYLFAATMRIDGSSKFAAATAGAISRRHRPDGWSARRGSGPKTVWSACSRRA